MSDLSQSALQALKVMMDTSVQAGVAPIHKKLTEVETIVTSHSQRLDKLEAAAAPGTASGSSCHTSPGKFVPTHVEIKGFCEWKDRRTAGVTRDEAEALLVKLVDKLPATIRHKVGELEVYGYRSNKIKVNISPPAAVEVALIWKECLKDDVSLQHNGSELYTTAEREPAKQKRYQTGGKVRAYLESKAKSKEATATAICSWEPSWDLTVKASRGDALVGKVEADGTVEWLADGLQAAFGIDVATAKMELAAFKG